MSRVSRGRDSGGQSAVSSSPRALLVPTVGLGVTPSAASLLFSELQNPPIERRHCTAAPGAAVPKRAANLPLISSEEATCELTGSSQQDTRHGKRANAHEVTAVFNPPLSIHHQNADHLASHVTRNTDNAATPQHFDQTHSPAFQNENLSLSAPSGKSYTQTPRLRTL